jgi:ABC-type transport system involved in multi-copper enzyme maturation permease subunit
MPIYSQAYESYTGEYPSRFRWVATAGQELRVLFSRKLFLFLIFLGNFHLFLRLMLLYTLDVLSQNPVGIFEGLSELRLEETGAWVYFDFLRMQSPLIFLTVIYAGAGMICNDFRNNLMEVYFSKPFNWKDYVLGKFAALLAIGMGLLALPALVMATAHVLFKPEMSSLLESLRLSIPIVVFSLMIVATSAAGVLASSSLVNSSRFAAVAIFMVLVVTSTLPVVIALLMQEENYLALALPVTANNVGEYLFQEHRYQNPVDVWWGWSAMYIGAVFAIGTAIVCRKARRAETGR